MIFSVETSVEIIDPESGESLGTTDLITGMLEVVTVDDEYSTCKVIDGSIEDMAAGDRVY